MYLFRSFHSVQAVIDVWNKFWIYYLGVGLLPFNESTVYILKMLYFGLCITSLVKSHGFFFVSSTSRQTQHLVDLCSFCFFFLRLSIKTSDNFIYQNHNAEGDHSIWTDYFLFEKPSVCRLTQVRPILPFYNVFDWSAVKRLVHN